MPPSSALVRRQAADLASMPPPPPPTTRTKRPITVLDEDEYTDALSDIIARDYFPGLAEAKAQGEYLSALESGDQTWIREAGQNLRDPSSAAKITKARRTSRDLRFDTPQSWNSRTPVPDTPRGNTGAETPLSTARSEHDGIAEHKKVADTSNISVSEFQAKYTSEDNESFNTVLDKQNNKRREKHAYLWTPDQRIPSSRLLTHRANETKLLIERQESESLAAKDGRELVPITTGAITSRPAKPDTWRQTHPNNGLMFLPDSIDESGLQTIMEVKEAASKAGPRQIIYANTRFPPSHTVEDPGPIPPSPSLNTTIIARRDAARAGRATSESSAFAGGETPRVNGYSFVDEDEPDPEEAEETIEPTYRDLLAGQAGDSTPNPFTIHDPSAREDLHLRLVERDNAKKRSREKQIRRPSSPSDPSSVVSSKTSFLTTSTPVSTSKRPSTMTTTENMTPAARKLMHKLGGRTPLPGSRATNERMTSKEMWTPGLTPRRK